VTIPLGGGVPPAVAPVDQKVVLIETTDGQAASTLARISPTVSAPAGTVGIAVAVGTSAGAGLVLSLVHEAMSMAMSMKMAKDAMRFKLGNP